MQQKTRTVLLSIGVVLLGFFREYLFANINWIYLTLTKGRMNAARDEFQFLIHWEVSEILTLKWILTILFSILFFALTYLIFQLHFKNKTYNKIVILVFSVLIGLAALLFVIGKLFHIYPEMYAPIRTIMGMVQSFIPLMFLGLLFRFLPEIKNN